MDEEKQPSNRGNKWKRYQQPIKGIAIAPERNVFIELGEQAN